MMLTEFLIGDLVLANQSNMIKAFFITDVVIEGQSVFYSDGNTWFSQSILEAI